MPNIKALALTVWDKNIFKDFLLYLYVKSENPQHRTNFYSRAIIWSILVEGLYIMLHAKYESSSPYGLGQEDFKVFSFGCHGNQSSSWNSYLWSILKVHHPRIISVKFHWNLLAGFRGEDFLSNCSRTDKWTDARQWSITIAHPEHVVLRWAKKWNLFWEALGKGEKDDY